MKIRVVGFDPSMRHWGIASAMLDLTTGFLDTPVLQIVEPIEPTGKQVRQNTIDMVMASQLANVAIAEAYLAKVIFVECPVGSQSAAAMKAYGVCVGILGSIMSQSNPLVEVTALEVKKALANNANATKAQMIAAATKLYPEAIWPRYEKSGAKFKKGELHSKCEHVADAIGAIHAGVNTPMFQNLLKLYKD
jgi:Holliday junction resolvasome RuvABC endonuclease subunit